MPDPNFKFAAIKNKFRLICFLCVFISCSASRAQSDEKPEKKLLRVEDLANLPIEDLAQVEITSISTGTQKKVSEAPSITTVITADEIEAMGATTVEEALASVPGLHVVASSQGFFPRYLLRGTSNRNLNPQVLFLYNGVPDSGIVRNERSSQVGILPVKMVERIEIIRGPGSALYGADAVAGVINIVTKSAEDIRGHQAGLQSGSFDTFESWYLFGGPIGNSKTSLMLDYRETAGQKEEIQEDLQSRLDRLRGTNASLTPGPGQFSYRWLGALADIESGAWRLRISHIARNNAGMGYGLSGSLDPQGRIRRQRSIIDLTHSTPQWLEMWDLTNRVSFHRYEREVDTPFMIYPPGANLGKGVFPNGVLGSLEYSERQFRFDNSIVSRGFGDHTLNLGAGLSFHELYDVKDAVNFNPDLSPRPGLTRIDDTAEISLPETSRSNYYLYGQDEWYFAKDWEFVGGLRYDHYNDVGGTTNPRAGFVWKATPQLTTKLLYGTAFRAPSFGELYNRNNPSIIGNPNLKPERIDVYELGNIYQFNPSLDAALSLFSYYLRDMIVYERDPIGTATARNAAAQTGKGFEMEFNFQATRELSFKGNYSYVQIREVESEKSPGLYPTDQAYLRGDWSFQENWILGSQIFYVGKQEREPTDPRGPVSPAVTTDLILRRKALAKRWDLRFAIRNIFDASVKEPSPVVANPAGGPQNLAAVPGDFPQARRSFMMELNYHF